MTLFPFWGRRPATPSVTQAAMTLSAAAARARAIADIPIREKHDRIVAELRRSGARSAIPPRDEVVAPVRAARTHRKEKTSA